ncbi:hypothetical protein BVI1335_320122 [Burkholderia vietnamiensis]|nr:hypothetical protein BVI1335_320122 [Burkholderia vietnamiensis]
MVKGLSRKLRLPGALSALDEIGENLALWRNIFLRQTEKLRYGPGPQRKPTPTADEIRRTNREQAARGPAHDL